MNGKTITLICLGAVGLLAGCQSVSAIRTHLGRDLAVTLDHARTTGADLPSHPGKGLAGLYQLALARSPEYQSAGLKVRKCSIDVEQASSVIIPRAAIVGRVSPVMSDEKDTPEPLEGGLSLSYDFMGALLREPSVRVGLARWLTAKEEQRIIAMRLEAQLFQELANYFQWKKLRELLVEETRLCNEAYSTTQGMVEAGVWGEGLMNPYMRKLQTEDRLIEIDHELNKVRSRFKRIGGTKVMPDTYADEFERLVQAQAATHRKSASRETLLVQAWGERPEVRIAGLELLISLDKAKLAKWCRFSKIRFTFGVGRIWDARVADYVSFLPSLEGSYALFDAGDQRRQLQLSDVEKEQAVVQIRGMVVGMVNDLDELSEEVRTNRERLALIQTRLKEVPTPKGDAIKQDLQGVEINLVRLKLQQEEVKSSTECIKSVAKLRVAAGSELIRKPS